MAGKIIVESVTDSLAVGSTIIDSAKSEIVWLLPPEMLIFASQFGLTDKCKALIENGGLVRGITRVTNTYAKVIGQLLDISSIYLDLEELSLDDQLRAFWTDNLAYADYLMSTFEFEWQSAVEAKKILQEL
jgi:hypothetical protein